MSPRSKLFLASIVSSLLLSNSVFAAGFSILEQSAEGLGTAFAGATAGYGDGSEIFFNPAAMGSEELSCTTVTATGNIIMPQAEFTNQGSTINPALGGSPLAGDNGPDGGEMALVPNLYVVEPLGEKFTAGFGVNAPWGLATEYDREWVGRYHAVRSELMAINLNPALAYNVTPDFSIGAGMQAMYVSAELSNMIDFGTIGVGALGLPTAARLGLLPQAADGYGVVSGDDWAYGYSLGASYRYDKKSKIGLAYRSQAEVKIRGDAEFEVPTAAMPLTASGYFTDTSAGADITLPDTLSMGAMHWLNDDFALLGEVQWTNWSTFDELRIKYGSGQPDTVVNESWNDAWRFSAGAIYRLSDALLLKAGYTHDQTPVPGREHRTPRIPDNDRDWMAFGASYTLNDNWSLSASYAHLFIKKSETEFSSSTGDVLKGDWETSVDLLSAQLTYRFG